MLYHPDGEEKVVIENWSVREVDGEGGKTRHLCGSVNGDGRASSEIKEFDPETMSFVTRSGKVYETKGWPGKDIDAEFVWANWCVINSITNVTDVSTEYLKNE